MASYPSRRIVGRRRRLRAAGATQRVARSKRAMFTGLPRGAVQLHQNASHRGVKNDAQKPKDSSPDQQSQQCIKRDILSARARRGSKRVLRGRSSARPRWAAVGRGTRVLACRQGVDGLHRRWHDATYYCARKRATRAMRIALHHVTFAGRISPAAGSCSRSVRQRPYAAPRPNRWSAPRSHGTARTSPARPASR